jgi:hypothetical protein
VAPLRQRHAPVSGADVWPGNEYAAASCAASCCSWNETGTPRGQGGTGRRHARRTPAGGRGGDAAGSAADAHHRGVGAQIAVRERRVFPTARLAARGGTSASGAATSRDSGTPHPVAVAELGTPDRARRTPPPVHRLARWRAVRQVVGPTRVFGVSPGCLIRPAAVRWVLKEQQTHGTMD